MIMPRLTYALFNRVLTHRHLVKGEMYTIEPTDSFDITIYEDQLGVPAVKSIKWEKVQAGLAFPETSILPGDQILSK